MYTTRKLRAVRARGEVVWVKREMQNNFLHVYHFMHEEIMLRSAASIADHGRAD